MSEGHDVTLGPVMIYSDKGRDLARFYGELVGLTGDDTKGSIWLKTEHADVVIHGRDERDAPPEVRTAGGFVVWFGVSDVNGAFQKARKEGWLVGDSYGDYFFARDPDGRVVGIYATEGHHHHDHDQ
jgi:hypothetical protein